MKNVTAKMQIFINTLGNVSIILPPNYVLYSIVLATSIFQL